MTEECILALAHETARSEWYTYAVRSPGDLAASLASFGRRIAEAAVKEATKVLNAELQKMVNRIAELASDRAALLFIARELAEKHTRGTQCCTACAAPPYMGVWSHNQDCPVVLLQQFNGG